MSSLQIVTASRAIPAPADDIFALLSDPRRHQLLDGSGTVRGCAEAPESLDVGAAFTMQMRLGGFSYRSRNEVVEFDPPRRIAWRTEPHGRLLRLIFGGQTWRFTIEDGGDESVVAESWDPTTIDRSTLATRMMRFSDANREGMQATLGRLHDYFASSHSDADA